MLLKEEWQRHKWIGTWKSFIKGSIGSWIDQIIPSKSHFSIDGDGEYKNDSNPMKLNLVMIFDKKGEGEGMKKAQEKKRGRKCFRNSLKNKREKGKKRK